MRFYALLFQQRSRIGDHRLGAFDALALPFLNGVRRNLANRVTRRRNNAVQEVRDHVRRRRPGALQPCDYNRASHRIHVGNSSRNACQPIVLRVCASWRRHDADRIVAARATCPAESVGAYRPAGPKNRGSPPSFVKDGSHTSSVASKCVFRSATENTN